MNHTDNDLDEKDLEMIRDHYFKDYQKEIKRNRRKEGAMASQASHSRQAHGYPKANHNSYLNEEEQNSQYSHHYHRDRNSPKSGHKKRADWEDNDGDRFGQIRQGGVHQVAGNDFIERLKDNKMKTANLEESGNLFLFVWPGGKTI